MNLLFDLDGTLTDAGPGIAGCIRHALAELGRPAPAAADLGWCIGPPLRDSFAALLADDDPTLPDRAVALYRQRYETAGLFENSVYPGIADGLLELRADGHELRVATSKPHVYARRILAHFGLHESFAEVYGAELSGVNADKRELIRHVLSAELFNERPWMIGDRRHDIEGAHANGLPAVGVLWGYGSRSELQAAGADLLVESMEDLVAWTRRES